MIHTTDELTAMAAELLAKSADKMAYLASAQEQFYYILDCQRVIRGLTERLQLGECRRPSE